MAIGIGDQIQIGGKRVANLDANYGPYNSTNEAISILGPSGRNVMAVGLTVGIKDETYKEIVEYWFKKDESDNFILVKKETSKPILDLSDFNATSKKYLPEPVTECDFIYQGEAVFTIPYSEDGINYVLAYVNATIDGTNVKKTYLIEKTIIRELWEGDTMPEKLYYYIPTALARKIQTMEESTYWN